ncbi:MAG: PQQ-binding-like beta-propeller repeat protein [Ignisphaera sp.]|uniref:Pyrrolo-quinoline quinone repeat domain-containing protein n=1 Tax=Ignisphaera aggregans TaxID=334771 RepID=A0A7C4NLF0_9CREN
MNLKLILIAVLFLILLTSFLILLTYLRKPPEVSEKPRRIDIEPISAIKVAEPPPSDLLPQKLPWVVEKGTVKTDRFYAGDIPRRPKVILKVNVSADMVGKLAEAVVEGDKVFLADSEGVYALDKYSGDLIWGVEVYFDNLAHRAMKGPGPITKWRALGLWRFVETYGIGKYLYVGTSSSEEGDAYLLAIDKDVGELVWKIRLESEKEASSKSSVTSNLVAINGKIYVGSVGPEGYVFAVSEKGELLWRRSIGGNVRGLTYGERRLFVTSEYRKKLYAFDSESGELLWVYEHDSELATPSYGRGRVITVDSLGKILAISTSGELLWKKSLGIGEDVDTNSYIALSRNYIYAVRSLGERPRNLYVLDFDGNTIGSFTLAADEDGGAPAVSQDVVVLPVLRKNSKSKVYLLWKGFHNLSEFYFDECGGSGWIPKVSISYGEIFIVACPNTLYKLVDIEKPTISDVEVSYNETLTIKVKAYDEQSALYKVVLVYSINNSKWIYRDMNIATKYVIEPIGGYGLKEELYIIEVPIGIAKVEFYIIAIDNVGNYEVTKVYGYRTFYTEK